MVSRQTSGSCSPRAARGASRCLGSRPARQPAPIVAVSQRPGRSPRRCRGRPRRYSRPTAASSVALRDRTIYARSRCRQQQCRLAPDPPAARDQRHTSVHRSAPVFVFAESSHAPTLAGEHNRSNKILIFFPSGSRTDAYGRREASERDPVRDQLFKMLQPTGSRCTR
jgi:hypothetical protein